MFTTVSVQLSPTSLLRLVEWQRREDTVDNINVIEKTDRVAAFGRMRSRVQFAHRRENLRVGPSFVLEQGGQ